MSMTLISEQVLGSAAASVSFTSIPQTYTDLVLEIIASDNSASGQDARIQFNSDTGTNYSRTRITGDGSIASSVRDSNITSLYVLGSTGTGAGSLTFGFARVDIQNYASTSVYKTVLGRANRAGSDVNAYAQLWRSTAAITSMLIFPNSSATFNTGSTFRLWGVK